MPPGARAEGGLLDRYDAFALDLDGVVWRSGSVIEGAGPAIAAIRSAGKRILFLTNNASYSPKAVVSRLGSQGIGATEDEVLNPVSVARPWLRERGLLGAPAFVLGDTEVERQFDDLVDVVPVAVGEVVQAVVVARDTRFDFSRLTAAASAVRAGAAFVAVNRDMVMPVAGGVEPGTGAILAAVEAASGRAAEVLGKPESPMMKAAQEILSGSRVVMIGDQPSSDVAGARTVGWDACIVLTGLTSSGDVIDPRPDHIFVSLADAIGGPRME